MEKTTTPSVLLDWPALAILSLYLAALPNKSYKRKNRSDDSPCIKFPVLEETFNMQRNGASFKAFIRKSFPRHGAYRQLVIGKESIFHECCETEFGTTVGVTVEKI